MNYTAFRLLFKNYFNEQLKLNFGLKSRFKG